MFQLYQDRHFNVKTKCSFKQLEILKLKIANPIRWLELITVICIDIGESSLFLWSLSVSASVPLELSTTWEATTLEADSALVLVLVVLAFFFCCWFSLSFSRFLKIRSQLIILTKYGYEFLGFRGVEYPEVHQQLAAVMAPAPGL